MAVDMNWRDAMAVRCIASVFSQECKGMGWPDRMEPLQLASMQRPHGSGDTAGGRLVKALEEALLDACKAGDLEHVAEVRRVVTQAACTEQSGFASEEWLARDFGGRGARSVPAKYEDITHYLVGPDAFVAWLAVQGMEPSQHIAAWLKVRGVAAVAGAQAAPAIEAQDVTDWPSLVRYRQQFASVAAQKRPAWLPEHVALLAGQLQQECSAGQGRGALGRLGEELGATRQALAGLLGKHHYNARTGEKERSAATPFDGMGARKTA